MTTGPSNGDHYYAAGSQKTESIQHAADVLRKLIHKLPDKDADKQKTFDKPIDFTVDSPPFKNLPYSVNDLPLDALSETDTLGASFGSNQPPAPPGADPDAYKVYRAMALKLAGTKHTPAHKKPYLILSDDEFKSISSRPFPSNHIQTPPHRFNHGPKHPNFEIQKTIQYEFKDLPEIVINRRNTKEQDVKRQ